MATTINYNLFLEIIKDLPIEDIRATCITNKLYGDFCHRPTFWQDIIRISYNVTIPNATINDYTYLQKLTYIPFENTDDPQDAELFNNILSQMRQKEIDAYINNLPVKYYGVNPLYFTLPGDYWRGESALNGVFFLAYTFEGGLLKAYNYNLQHNGDNILYSDLTFAKQNSEADDEIMESLVYMYDSEARESSDDFFLVEYPQVKIY